MLSKTAWFKILIVKIQNLRVLDRFKAQDRFKASKGTYVEGGAKRDTTAWDVKGEEINFHPFWSAIIVPTHRY